MISDLAELLPNLPHPELDFIATTCRPHPLSSLTIERISVSPDRVTNVSLISVKC